LRGDAGTAACFLAHFLPPVGLGVGFGGGFWFAIFSPSYSNLTAVAAAV
jgi:hypothetical protein